MGTTSLCFVLTDRVSDFDATCAAARFDGRAAQRVRALYSGLARSERRMAHEVAARLWLPVSLEPMLTGSSYGFDDVPPTRTVNDPPIAAPELAAGAAALAIALRHRGACIAFAMKAVFAERIARDLAELLPDHVTRHPIDDRSVLEVELNLSNEAPCPAIAPDDVSATVDATAAYLTELGADRIVHPGGTLLDHLRRTARLIASFEARPALVLAALCHAAYGTSGFDQSLLDVGKRDQLAQRIGVEAEAIVYAYAACDRAQGHPSPSHPHLRDRFSGQVVPLSQQLVHDLAQLTCANELDVLSHASHLPATDQDAIKVLLRSLRPMLGYRAALAVHRTADHDIELSQL